MEDFLLKKCCISKGKGGDIAIYTPGQTNCLTKEEAEKLRDWLDEALRKPQYEIIKEVNWYIVRDTTHKEPNDLVATFYRAKPIDAREEAEKLCQRLNEQDEDKPKPRLIVRDINTL